MLKKEIVDQLIINLAALIIIANLLSHIHVFQRVMLEERRSIKQDFALSLIFVVLIIGSTTFEIKTGS